MCAYGAEKVPNEEKYAEEKDVNKQLEELCDGIGDCADSRQRRGEVIEEEPCDLSHDAFNSTVGSSVGAMIARQSPGATVPNLG